MNSQHTSNSNKKTSTLLHDIEHISFLGVGSMASAILEGLLRNTANARFKVTATTNSARSAQRHSDLPRTEVLSVEQCADANKRAVTGAQLVVLGVKPWAITDLLREIAQDLALGATVVSVAAGITTELMREALGSRDDVQILRAMPNTPALIGRGVTGLAAAAASERATALGVALFECVGEVLVVPEREIDALSAISGSGPAYLFWFAEQLTAAAERAGFTADQARVLGEGTVTGAAALLHSSDKSPAELRREVTSPGGTTEKALEVFNAASPEAIFDGVVRAVKNRAAELAKKTN
ncbi:pyrroline-5-carboxylate reductase [Canibacter sp. lx-72]|uniref:pyrroline-5-carboxylate reductase n=1 Tax=Canibacter zhuwentaonis TaxID=2837491 RepID=UPI001BDD65FA|nr:pyrroline-5-carboxylate reductase [Canibacter zhuwentaonis]MBT1018553.1 pyrroline-5-carboxylate reductase [Canibacter zhuwentaonis]MBT1035748.1 pyrroline-5-carboxylate reductase [Canibacter zhuwentaonis]